MKIIYKTGDVTLANEDTIIHGCNAQGVMGSGVAKAIRERFPEVYAAYRKIYEISGLQLGEVISVACGDKVILNAITQGNYGYKGGRYVSYDALVTIFEKVDQAPISAIAMPKIGSHLGGGDWEIIVAIIENTLKRVQPVVYVLEGDQ